MTKLIIKVVPGASRDQVSGWLGDALKIRVMAPPEKGKANAAVIALLAKAFDLPQRNIQIVVGETSTQKTLEVIGITREEMLEKLNGEQD